MTVRTRSFEGQSRPSGLDERVVKVLQDLVDLRQTLAMDCSISTCRNAGLDGLIALPPRARFASRAASAQISLFSCSGGPLAALADESSAPPLAPFLEPLVDADATLDDLAALETRPLALPVDRSAGMSDDRCASGMSEDWLEQCVSTAVSRAD